MLFADAAATITGSRRTRDGYLVAEVRFARAGVYRYQAIDLRHRDGFSYNGDVYVNVFRPLDEVFSARAMRSFAYVPITVDHPAVAVTEETWRSFSVGHLGGEIHRDGEFVRATIVVQDRSAIEAVERGKQELSAGYQCEVEFVDGVAPNGTAYRAIQRGIIGNHIAIVERGRAGHQCRIGVAR